jgi:hypothetical protein
MYGELITIMLLSIPAACRLSLSAWKLLHIYGSCSWIFQNFQLRFIFINHWLPCGFNVMVHRHTLWVGEDNFCARGLKVVEFARDICWNDQISCLCVITYESKWETMFIKLNCKWW